jgi:hypothetical protein
MIKKIILANALILACTASYAETWNDITDKNIFHMSDRTRTNSNLDTMRNNQVYLKNNVQNNANDITAVKQQRTNDAQFINDRRDSDIQAIKDASLSAAIGAQQGLNMKAQELTRGAIEYKEAAAETFISNETFGTNNQMINATIDDLGEDITTNEAKIKTLEDALKKVVAKYESEGAKEFRENIKGKLLLVVLVKMFLLLISIME